MHFLLQSGSCGRSLLAMEALGPTEEPPSDRALRGLQNWSLVKVGRPCDGLTFQASRSLMTLMVGE